MTLKLFYSPDTCGAASFIAAYSIGLNIDCEQVNIQTHMTSSGINFFTVNPKGNIPCLILDDGTMLNETVAVLNWIADKVGLMNPSKIAPLNCTQDRYVINNSLSFIATELHPAIGGLFETQSEEILSFLRDKCATKLAYCEKCLLPPGREYILWSTPTIADFYLYVVLSWCSTVNLSLTSYPRTLAFFDRMSGLPMVKDAHWRMSQNPTSIMGTMQERVQPFLDGVSAELKSVQDRVQFQVDNASAAVKPAVDNFQVGMLNAVESTQQKASEMMESPTSKAITINKGQLVRPFAEDAENKKPTNSL